MFTNCNQYAFLTDFGTDHKMWKHTYLFNLVNKNIVCERALYTVRYCLSDWMFIPKNVRLQIKILNTILV